VLFQKTSACDKDILQQLPNSEGNKIMAILVTSVMYIKNTYHMCNYIRHTHILTLTVYEI
jgi:type III secretory pathway lipoprotein EscJ